MAVGNGCFLDDEAFDWHIEQFISSPNSSKNALIDCPLIQKLVEEHGVDCFLSTDYARKLVWSKMRRWLVEEDYKLPTSFNRSRVESLLEHGWHASGLCTLEYLCEDPAFLSQFDELVSRLTQELSNGKLSEAKHKLAERHIPLVAAARICGFRIATYLPQKFDFWLKLNVVDLIVLTKPLT